MRKYVEETKEILLNPATQVFIDDAVAHLQQIIKEAKCAIADIETALKDLEKRAQRRRNKEMRNENPETPRSELFSS